jgi:hypothetical protein
MKRIFTSLLVIFAVSGVVHAVKPEPPKEKIAPVLSVPLSGTKTTFRFIVRNDGKKPVVVYSPFANLTRLIVTFPNGKQKKIGNWKEMERPPDPLQPGKSIQSDVDILNWVEMKEKGDYKISFSVNGIESNHIIVTKD